MRFVATWLFMYHRANRLTLFFSQQIQNDIRAGAQRWNNTSSTPLHHPQPTTPHSISTAFFENDGKR